MSRVSLIDRPTARRREGHRPAPRRQSCRRRVRHFATPVDTHLVAVDASARTRRARPRRPPPARPSARSRVDQRERLRHRRGAVLLVQPVLGRVQQQRPGRRSAPRRAARPGRRSRRRPRAARSPAAARGRRSVASRCVGHERHGLHAAVDSSRDRPRARPPSSRRSVRPPSEARRDVVGVALDLGGQRERRVVVEELRPPATQRAGRRRCPATIAADEEPRPRRAGSVAAAQPQPGRRAAASRASNAARASPARRGAARRARRLRRPRRRRRSTGRPVGAPATSTSSYRSSARPSASKPGPRLALVAGTRTVHRPRPSERHRQREAERGRGGVRVDRRRVDRRRARRTIAQSGSLRPWPVTVQTTARPGRSHALRRAPASRPATPAADAGSTKTPSSAGEQPVGGQDLPVGDGLDRAAGLVPGGDRQVPRRGVADPDRGGHGLGVGDRLARHERRRAGGLEAQHPRGPRAAPSAAYSL